jgi:octopine/nopaline transport system permease protein
MDIGLIASSILPLLSGIPATLTLASLSLTLGFFLAVLIAIGQRTGRILVVAPCRFFVSFVRSTPLLVQIFIIYYGSGQFAAELRSLGVWTVFRDPWFSAILALSLNTAAYASEIIRGGLDSVGRGLKEAGLSLGLTRIKLFLLLEFPLAIRQALPGYGNEVISMIKATALASTITIIEITGVARNLISETFRPLEIFVLAGSIYLILNAFTAFVIAALERKLNRYQQPWESSSQKKSAHQRTTINSREVAE